jgi:hypothetical protein
MQQPRTPSSIRTTLIAGACLSLQPLLLNALSVPVMGYLIHRLGPEAYGQWMLPIQHPQQRNWRNNSDCDSC